MNKGSKTALRGAHIWLLALAALLLLAPYFGINIFTMFTRESTRPGSAVPAEDEVRSVSSRDALTDDGARRLPSEHTSGSKQSLTDIEELLKK